MEFVCIADKADEADGPFAIDDSIVWTPSYSVSVLIAEPQLPSVRTVVRLMVDPKCSLIEGRMGYLAQPQAAIHASQPCKLGV